MGTCKAKIVVALGGNALQTKDGPATAEAQLEVLRTTCAHLAKLEASNYETAIVHGNGPQVGRILLACETAKNVTSVMPFDVCGAMSQGYIGYHIQQAMREQLDAVGRSYVPVVTLVTQVVVSPDDPAFSNPTKPIGPFYSQSEAEQLMAENGYVMKEDAGRGWRRVVASPTPLDIVESETIKRLWDSTVLITCGGGGIPVMERNGRYEGVPAVIDKDLAAALLAEKVNADVLLILTEVEKVSLNYHQPNQVELEKITVSEAKRYVAEGHFAPGSMLPKILSAIKFVGDDPHRKAIITSLDKAIDALEGRTGTTIVKDFQ